MGSLSFTWPWALLGLALLVPLGWAYVRRLRLRDEARERYAALGLAPVSPPRRAYMAPLLLLLGVTVSLAAMARPVANVPEPRREGTVILAFDISTSMTATDIEPTRLDAAKTAALAFVEKQPETVKVGVVAFGPVAMVTQQPTLDKAQVSAAIRRLSPSGSTSVGRGIVTSLSALAGKPIQLTPDTAEQDIGWYGGSAIVILSDGEETGGPDPRELADLASSAGVTIHTIGLGTAAGVQLKVDGFTLSTRLDEGLLRDIAHTTNGSYHQATDATGLNAVYDAIEPAWTVRQVPHEITSWVVLAALLLAVAGAGWSVARTGRVV